MKLNARMDCNRLARQLFGMLKIRKNCVYFLSYACGRRKKEQVEEIRKKTNKIENFMFACFKLVKG